MSGVKHTRGPWKIDFGHPRGNPCGISAKNDGRLVTRFGVFARPSTPEALANARLIAAAPDLLEALAVIVTDCSQVWSDAEFPALKQARSAITRATGDRPEKAGRAVAAWLRSFDPKHEIKIGTVGYALSKWTRASDERQASRRGGEA